MLYKTIAIIISSFLCLACKCQDERIETAQEFLGYVVNMDTVNVFKLMPDERNKKSVAGYFYAQCKGIKHILQKYGVPSKDKFFIHKETMANKVYSIVIIPIFKGLDTAENLRDAYIAVNFFPDDWNIVKMISGYKIAEHPINERELLINLPVIKKPEPEKELDPL